MKNTKPRIAVLGAGIMGSSTALYLARGGNDVSLFDGKNSPLSAASRWSEGKIHLGFMYASDTSMNTARKVIPGGLAFKRLTEELIGTSIAPAITPTGDTYLCHRDSVVRPDAMEAYYKSVCKMVRDQPDASGYVVDASNCQSQKLTKAELDDITDSPDILSGYKIPERSVSTTWIADRFADALHSQPGIEQLMDTRITQVYPEKNDQEKWYVKSGTNTYGPFDYVINALWEGRMSIDQTVGMEMPAKWSNRFRLSIFLRTMRPFDLPSVCINTGPFGNIMNYNDRDFYLSWYPTGLAIESSSIEPPKIPILDESKKQEIIDTMIAELGNYLPKIRSIHNCIEHSDLKGGWVFAQGQGDLSDPKSGLHYRSDFGIIRKGNYISVDTGKYSTAPWLARRVAGMVLIPDKTCGV